MTLIDLFLDGYSMTPYYMLYVIADLPRGFASYYLSESSETSVGVAT